MPYAFSDDYNEKGSKRVLREGNSGQNEEGAGHFIICSIMRPSSVFLIFFKARAIK